jgi:hypothetical protein
MMVYEKQLSHQQSSIDGNELRNEMMMSEE